VFRFGPRLGGSLFAPAEEAVLARRIGEFRGQGNEPGPGGDDPRLVAQRLAKAVSKIFAAPLSGPGSHPANTLIQSGVPGPLVNFDPKSGPEATDQRPNRHSKSSQNWDEPELFLDNDIKVVDEGLEPPTSCV